MQSDLIIELFKKELRVRYKHFFLGYIWSIANPLFYAMLYFFVFKLIMNIKIPNYPLFLVSGLFAWQWLSNSILVAPMTFIGNAPLIKKTIFKRFLIPLVSCMQDGFHFLMSVPVIIGLIFYFNGQVNIKTYLYIIILFLIQFIYTYALNLMIASINLFFRDIERIVQLLVTLMFYGTPILFSEAMVPEKFQKFLIFHPFASLFINWRNIFLNNTLELNYLISSLIWSLFFLLISHYVYKKLNWRFAEVL